MAVDLGDVLPGLDVAVVSNATGAAADPTLLVLTITKPDGTTLTGTYPAAPGDTVTISRASAGNYSATVTTTAAGRWTARWVATGNACERAEEQSWAVEIPSVPPIIGLDEAKAWLRMGTGTTNDDELGSLLYVVTEVCERRTRQTWRRLTVTGEMHDGGRELIPLRRRPVLSVTSVTEDGVALTASDYTLIGRPGRLRRGSVTWPRVWSAGDANVAVTYTAGPTDGLVPEYIRHGCKTLLRHLWETQRGASTTARQPVADMDYDPRSGFTVPRRVAELWALAPMTKRAVG